MIYMPPTDHFTLVLPNLTYQEGIRDDDTPNISFFPISNGTEHDEKVLSFCYRRAHNASEIANHLGISDSSYLRKQILENLEKNGYLGKSKISKSAYYKTNPDMVSIH